jgi:hypothetical protein
MLSQRTTPQKKPRCAPRCRPRRQQDHKNSARRGRFEGGVPNHRAAPASRCLTRVDARPGVPLDRGTARQSRRCGTTVAGGAIAMPPAPARGRDGSRRSFASWSRSRPPRRSERSLPSRYLPGLARAESAEAAGPPPGGRRACAGPRPPSGRRPDCDEQAKASAERRAPALRP